MSGDIMSTWPILLTDYGRYCTNYEGKILYEGREFKHISPIHYEWLSITKEYVNHKITWRKCKKAIAQRFHYQELKEKYEK
jgi:hypothetical protein